MAKEKQASLKSMQIDFKRNKNILKICQSFLSILHFVKIALISFASGRVLAYEKISLFEIKLLLIVILIIIFSRFFSSKIEIKKVELEQLEQMICFKKIKI